MRHPGDALVRYKPFLSHKREDAVDMELLRDELVVRGAGGWQDTRELRLGQRWMAAFRSAIGKETGGFIWYGTRKALASRTICKVEVPLALRRARRRKGGAYPVVPLFVDLQPSEDADAIKRAFGSRRGRRLLDLNGVIRNRGEDLPTFSKRAARQYVKDLIREHPGDNLHAAITTGREPTGQHHLSLDWRRLARDHRRDPGRHPRGATDQERLPAHHGRAARTPPARRAHRMGVEPRATPAADRPTTVTRRVADGRRPIRRPA
jgi:hypothetical protein